MAITLVGMSTLLLGLIVAVPWLSYASWHAYRDLVPHADLPESADMRAHAHPRCPRGALSLGTAGRY